MESSVLLKLMDTNISRMNGTQLLTLYESLHVFDLYLEQEGIILTSLYVPVFLMGFIGNVVVALLVFTNHQLRNSTNLYLCNMAIADFLGNVNIYLYIM